MNWGIALGTVISLLQASSSRAATASPAEMAPYVETIPGTNVTFEMVPIPGGTLPDGQPADGEGPRRRRGAAAPGHASGPSGWASAR